MRTVDNNIAQHSTPYGILLVPTRPHKMPSKMNPSVYQSRVYIPCHGTVPLTPEFIIDFIHESHAFNHSDVAVTVSSYTFINSYGIPVNVSAGQQSLYKLSKSMQQIELVTSALLDFSFDGPVMLLVKFSFTFVNQRLDFPIFDVKRLEPQMLRNQATKKSGSVITLYPIYASDNKDQKAKSSSSSKTKRRRNSKSKKKAQPINPPATRNNVVKSENNKKGKNNVTITIQNQSSHEKGKPEEVTPKTQPKKMVDKGEASKKDLKVAPNKKATKHPNDTAPASFRFASLPFLADVGYYVDLHRDVPNINKFDPSTKTYLGVDMKQLQNQSRKVLLDYWEEQQN